MFEYQVRTGLPLQVLLNNKDPKPTAERIPSVTEGISYLRAFEYYCYNEEC